MQQILERRYAGWREVFNPAQVERMATSTGGDLRDFFRLVRECLVGAGIQRASRFPVDDSILTQGENLLRREMLPIAAADAQWLKRIAQTKDPQLATIEELPRLARFFDTHLVLNYRNAEDWCDVHPLLGSEIRGV